MCTKARNVLIFHTDYLRLSDRLKNPCFKPLFETLKLSLAQLQVPVENFLLVVWPCYRYVKVSSGNKLSNAHTLVIIRQLERSQTVLVRNVKSTTQKKRPPLKMIFKQNHMIDLSIIFSFTSFQGYYVNLGPSAAEKNSGVYILFFTYFSSISYSRRNHLLN